MGRLIGPHSDELPFNENMFVRISSYEQNAERKNREHNDSSVTSFHQRLSRALHGTSMRTATTAARAVHTGHWLGQKHFELFAFLGSAVRSGYFFASCTHYFNTPKTFENHRTHACAKHEKDTESSVYRLAATQCKLSRTGV